MAGRVEQMLEDVPRRMLNLEQKSTWKSTHDQVTCKTSQNLHNLIVAQDEVNPNTQHQQTTNIYL